MAEPFLSEIRIMSFSFAPKGWALCNGQFLPINQNQALFSLLGTTYGGDGQSELRAARPAGARADPRRQRPHAGRERRRAGAHAHASPSCRRTRMPLNGTTATPRPTRPPGGTLPGATAASVYTRRGQPDALMHPATVANVGGSQAHQNMQPFLTLQLLHRPAGHLPEPELRRRTMAQPYVGEIRMFAGNFAPAGLDVLRGAAPADRRERDALPADRHDLRRRRRDRPSRCPTCAAACRSTRAAGFILGARPAAPRQVTLTVKQIPAHSHPLLAPHGVRERRPARQDNVLAAVRGRRSIVERVPSGRPWRRRDDADRREPAARRTCSRILCVNFIISLFGIFPTPDLGGRPWPIPSSPRSGSSRSTSRRRAGRSATGSSCRISQNTALFSLLGTTYGGDGKTHLRAARTCRAACRCIRARARA